jgi:2-oxoglutarate ferredoxin oxidoreductase subunit delta
LTEKAKKHPFLDERLCKKCNICATFCPKKVYDIRPGAAPKVARPDDCIACELCVLRCPDYAIVVKEDESK